MLSKPLLSIPMDSFTCETYCTQQHIHSHIKYMKCKIPKRKMKTQKCWKTCCTCRAYSWLACIPAVYCCWDVGVPGRMNRVSWDVKPESWDDTLESLWAGFRGVERLRWRWWATWLVDGWEWAEWLEFPEVRELLDRESALFMLPMLPQTLDLRDPEESVGDDGGVLVCKNMKKSK